jgi:hypothetical protein
VCLVCVHVFVCVSVCVRVHAHSCAAIIIVAAGRASAANGAAPTVPHSYPTPAVWCFCNASRPCLPARRLLQAAGDHGVGPGGAPAGGAGD